MKIPYRLESALSYAFSDYTRPSSYTRNFLMNFIFNLIKYDIDPLLYSEKELTTFRVKAKDFPIHEVMFSEEELKECFISKGPLKGLWFKEFPLGLRRVIERAFEERKKGLDWLDKEKLRNFFLSECKHPDLILIESEVVKVYERMSEKDVLASFLLYRDDPTYLFNGKSVYLIEAKTAKKDIPDGVRKILEYRKLLKEDYPRAFIKGLNVICSDWTGTEVKLCKENGITAWEVTCESVVRLT